ncbi:hypothetical protein Tco_1360912, partial [Tanacetum coccineum]
RFYTSAGNPFNEILPKLNIPDHRILKDGCEEPQEICNIKAFQDINSRAKAQTAKVSNNNKQKEQKAKAKKTNKYGKEERLATPTMSPPRE